MSATVGRSTRRSSYIKNICKRDPFTGQVVTGGIVTVRIRGSPGWTINRQPQFRAQPKDHCLVWVYSLFTDKPGRLYQSPCASARAARSAWSGSTTSACPRIQIEKLATNSANTVPVMMPYIDAFFMPRAYGDRPKVVPDGAVNFALPRSVRRDAARHHLHHRVFMRTGMEAVYTLLNVDRGVPEVWGSVYDVRDLLNATVKLRDGKPVTRHGYELARSSPSKKGPFEDRRDRHRKAA